MEAGIVVSPVPGASALLAALVASGLELDRLSGNAPVSERDLQALIELENRGQEIVLKYLKGDEVPQEEREFRRGRRLLRHGAGGRRKRRNYSPRRSIDEKC